MLNGRSIAYIYSKDLRQHCDRLPPILNRASMVQDLIDSYGLLINDQLYVIESYDATEDELKLFHSSDYIEFLKKVNNSCIDSDEFSKEQEEYGLNYDCPLLENNYDLIRTIAGSSLTGAKLLNANKCKIAINWFGGWHHAQRDSAEGFCYVNDIVLAIQKLSEKFERILYVDLDIHHGNGVQNAFELSRKILTLSLHKYSQGFYPGSGSLYDIGTDKGRYYTINVPFKPGINSKNYLKVFTAIFPKIVENFQPTAIVVQCGGDSLNGDPVGECNLTIKTIGECIKNILQLQLPTLFLGGGGYNLTNTARLWTYLTSIILQVDIDDDIPDTSEFFLDYGPTYELHISEGNQKDSNTDEWLKIIIDNILKYCDKLVKQ